MFDEAWEWVDAPAPLGGWFGTWWVTVLVSGGTSSVLTARHNGQDATAPGDPCPPDPPPCVTCFPQIASQYANFAASAPVPLIAGTAACPAGENPSDACPPSVGSPITVWVSGVQQAGPNPNCATLLALPGVFDRYQVCMRWTAADQVGAFYWDFADENASGARVSGINYDVPSGGIGQAISHTYDYDSLYDPVRSCFPPPSSGRPLCANYQRGPAISAGCQKPGGVCYPSGTPAFQVTVTARWMLEVDQCVTSNGGTRCTGYTLVNLQLFGEPNPWYSNGNLVPIFVLGGGADITPGG